MKIFLILIIFLLLIPIVLAYNITWRNITIIIPNITIPRINITLPKIPIIRNITDLNETRRVDILEILRSIKIPDLIKQRLKKMYDVIVNALMETIGKTIRDLAQLLITGNVTETNVSS